MAGRSSSTTSSSTMMLIKVVHRQPGFVVVDKPSGLRSVPGLAASTGAATVVDDVNADRNEGRNDDPSATGQAGTFAATATVMTTTTSSISTTMMPTSMKRKRPGGSHASKSRPAASSPANAVPTISTTTTPTSSSTGRLTSQEAWAKAVTSFASDIQKDEAEEENDNNGDDTDTDGTIRLGRRTLCLLATTAVAPQTVPRRYHRFVRYLQRSKRRLQLNSVSDVRVGILGRDTHRQLMARYHRFLNPPPSTASHESALGQVQVMLDEHGQPARRERHIRDVGDVEEEEEEEDAAASEPGTSASDVDQKAFAATTKRRILAATSDDPRHQDEEDPPRARPVHRLDCDTSGLLVIATTRQSASVLSKAWRDGLVRKQYLAVVTSWSPPPISSSSSPLKKGEPNGCIIDVPVEKDPHHPVKWRVAEDANKSKRSVTQWRILDDAFPLPSRSSDNHKNNDPNNRTGILLALTPITGRTHQLRVHCAHVGSGIVGDDLYYHDVEEYVPTVNHQGSPAVAVPPKDVVAYKGQSDQQLLLHAWKLAFPDPATSTNKCSYTCWPWWYPEQQHHEK